MYHSTPTLTPSRALLRLTIRTMLNNIKQRAESELAFSKYCRQLGVLVQLRDTSDILKEEEQNMSFTFDINKDPHFKMAREAGIKEGLHEGKSETAMRMLQKGFEMEVIAEVTGLNINEVHALKKDMH